MTVNGADSGAYRQPITGVDRGLSSVLALVLLVGVVAMGSIGILLTGKAMTDDSRETVELRRVELAFQELDDRMDAVARGRADERTVELSIPDDAGGAVREVEAGRFVIRRENITTGTSDTLVNYTMGAIVYRADGSTVAYQAGAVWRGTGNDSRLLSAPPFSYSTTANGGQPTLTVPLTAASGSKRVTSGRVRITDNGTVSPLNDVTVVEGDLIVLEISGDYYVGWANYFRRITNDAAITVDHANQTTTIEMLVPARAPSVESGVRLGAAQESLKLKQQATVDSYNSTLGGYSSSAGGDSRIVSAGPVYLKQDATVEGTLVAGDDVTFKQGSLVTGDLLYSDSSSLSFHNSPSTHVDGQIEQNASVSERTAVDGVIDRNVALVTESNSNASEPNVSSGQLQNCGTGPGCELGTGAYLLDSVDLTSGETLVLNTTAGPIDVVVRDQLSVRDGNVTVVGDGRVNVYLDGATGSEDFVMKGDATVSVPGERSPQFWLYMDSDAEAKLRQSADFTGVLYGPGPKGEPGTHITMSSTSDGINLYGAAVGDIEPITQEVKVHYDEALATTTPIETATSVPRLTFLHVSVHRVDIENDR